MGAGFVEDTIMNLKQRSGATSTSDALKHVREKVLTQAGNRLNDKDTATIVFVVTDGKCNDGCNTLVSEAKKLREAGPGVQVFAFGVGEADCDELEDIRGKDAGEVFGLPDYNFFEKLAVAVKEQMAKNSDVCVKN
ncbi:cartilage matrix protein-like [Watersipora subatra]|uniref:cartilage matrix protein-like n=1 Tax=Watersipora subatra TaxID=2589382 RepID=UPI00355BBCB2